MMGASSQFHDGVELKVFPTAVGKLYRIMDMQKQPLEVFC